MKKSTIILFVLILCVSFAGCGKGSRVTGTVTFSDGQPLTVGKVAFTDDNIIGFGTINEKGQYSMGLVNDGDGMPPGTYKVYITEAMIEGDSSLAQKDEDGNSYIPKVPAVDSKFTGPKSGLTCEVKGATKYDITVEKPSKPYKPPVIVGDTGS